MTGWRPDVVVRESAELAAAVAAELHGVPLVRVGIGLAEMEERMIRYAAPNVDRLRQATGALAARVPQVVVPLFAEDQHINARRVAETGAGRVAEPSATSIRDALPSMLTDPGYAERA